MGENAGKHIDALYILDPENGHAQDLAGTLLGKNSQKVCCIMHIHKGAEF